MARTNMTVHGMPRPGNDVARTRGVCLQHDTLAWRSRKSLQKTGKWIADTLAELSATMVA